MTLDTFRVSRKNLVILFQSLAKIMFFSELKRRDSKKGYYFEEWHFHNVPHGK